ncbi:MAG: sugar kinase [Planctomycetaceae bacterium]
MENPDVLCVGLVVADLVCAPIRRFPDAGGLETTDRLELSIGGCASNVAVDLTKLNVAVEVIGRIGNDALGEYVRKAMTEQGVGGKYLSVSTTSQTAATQVVNVAGEDRRFIHAVGANAELTGLEVSDEVLKQAKIIYVGGFGLNAALSGKNVADLFRRAREFGVLTVLDVVIGEPAIIREMLPDALPETDFFLPNRDEANVLTGLDEPIEQANEFRRLGAANVVVTLGEGGSLLLDQEGRLLQMPPLQVVQVDGTGGGDAFAAGFMYGLLKKEPLERCLQLGTTLGASCVQATGATTSVYRENELLAAINDCPAPFTVK